MSIRTKTYVYKNSPKDSFEYKAYTSVRGQRERCDNPNNKAYKHYGAKGIRVEYTNDEFVEWWKKEALRFPPGTKLTVDRLDTSTNYSFSNIRLIPWSENVRRSNSTRVVRYYAILEWDTLEVVEIVTSMKEVKDKTGMSYPAINSHCKYGRPNRSSRNYYFKYTVRYSNETELAQRIDVQEKSIVEAKEAPAYDYVYHSTNVHPRNPGSASLREREICGTGVKEEHQGSCDRVTAI